MSPWCRSVALRAEQAPVREYAPEPAKWGTSSAGTDVRQAGVQVTLSRSTRSCMNVSSFSHHLKSCAGRSLIPASTR